MCSIFAKTNVLERKGFSYHVSQQFCKWQPLFASSLSLTPLCHNKHSESLGTLLLVQKFRSSRVPLVSYVEEYLLTSLLSKYYLFLMDKPLYDQYCVCERKTEMFHWKLCCSGDRIPFQRAAQIGGGSQTASPFAPQ